MTEDSAPSQPSQTPLFYANTAGLRAGPFDMAIDFGYGTTDDEGKPEGPKWLARVAMSWEHAKALNELLTDHIESYEVAVGGLPNIRLLKLTKEGTDDDD